jgi:hypothetical protein
VYPVEDHSNWMEFYADTSEKIPKDLPPEKGPRVRMTVYVDADHAHDLVTRRSVTWTLTRDLRFIPPFCDYSRSFLTWNKQFSSDSGLLPQFMLRKVEPNFKEFLASPVGIYFQI